MGQSQFSASLQTTPSPDNAPDSLMNQLLKELGLFPLPNNVDISISNDKKFLNFRLKDYDPSDYDHLVFQLPLISDDLSALESSPNRSELESRYHVYINQYFDEIKEYAIQEGKYLHEIFPNLVFTIKIRVKSYESYLKKVDSNIRLQQKSPYIGDIIAERIVLTYIKNPQNDIELSQNEDELIRMCYKVAAALGKFRKATDFEMGPDAEASSAKTDNPYITKDYIAHPKPNGYQSLHLSLQHKHNKDLKYETQIRTFKMEDASKNDDRISHKGYYKPRILDDLSATKFPSYSVITSFYDDDGYPIVYDTSSKEEFYHYYNTPIRYIKDGERRTRYRISNIKWKKKNYNPKSIQNRTSYNPKISRCYF